jgi:hypothetical protein
MKVLKFWPQIVIIVLSLISFFTDIYDIAQGNAVRHYDFYSTGFFITLIVAVIETAILYYGGFKFLSAANMFFLFLIISGFILMLAKKECVISNSSTLMTLVSVHLIYYWGGFYDCFAKR